MQDCNISPAGKIDKKETLLLQGGGEERGGGGGKGGVLRQNHPGQEINGRHFFRAIMRSLWGLMRTQQKWGRGEVNTAPPPSASTTTASTRKTA